MMARATMHGIVIIIDRHAERGIIRDDGGMFYDFLRQDMVFWMDFQALGMGTAVTFEPRMRKRIGGAINVELRLTERPSHT
jgi:hypothetical protein